MEIIRIAGYTVEEKVEIAWRYLLPRLLEEHGITDKDIQFTDESLSFISNRYSREAGLRNFERNLAAIMRKRARTQGGGRRRRVGRSTSTRSRRCSAFRATRSRKRSMVPEVGVVTGLAWTATGGDLMLIEALRMPGSGRLTVTGQLGDVMRESVDAAYSYVRSRAAQHRHPGRDVQGVRPPRPPARRRDSEGRTERGHHADARDRERAERSARCAATSR